MSHLHVTYLGQTLQRLDYRISEWNPDLTSYLKKLEATKPVVVVGDLNVAHLDLDIYNFDVKAAAAWV
jgi:exonuclease III